jgi:hypothetical protein
MKYFYRAHVTPEAVLQQAERFFTTRGLGRTGGDTSAATWTDARGAVKLSVEIEGGHFTRATVTTSEVGESELDRLAKRFLAELHATEDGNHAVRGAY